jgi:hypothetical protein
MDRIRLTLPKMLENEPVIDRILDMILENADCIGLEVCACSTIWTAHLDMRNDPTVFAVELALRFDGLLVRLL